MMTIEQQTGYKRREVELCQDADVLLNIKHWDFDLKDEDFCQYVRERKGWTLKPEKMTSEEYKTLLTSGTEFDILELLEQTKWEGMDIDKELKTNLKMIQFIRGSLQDMWEIFNEHERF